MNPLVYIENAKITVVMEGTTPARPTQRRVGIEFPAGIPQALKDKILEALRNQGVESAVIVGGESYLGIHKLHHDINSNRDFGILARYHACPGSNDEIKEYLTETASRPIGTKGGFETKEGLKAALEILGLTEPPILKHKDSPTGREPESGVADDSASKGGL